MQELLDKINNKKAVIGIVGLGYVGLPLALCYQKAGFRVLGFDIDEAKIMSLREKKSYIHHITEADIAQMLDTGFQATSDYSKVAELDAIILCVPTPLNKYKEPDLSYVINTVEAAIPYIKKQQVISLESTTYPGTTEEEVVPRVQQKGYTIGKDYYILYSPEREDPGNKIFSTYNIPKILGGYTDNCKTVGISLYSSIIKEVIPVSSTRVAEMAKLLENIYRAVNIGLVNEMKIIADKMGINVFEVIAAAATKPFGFSVHYPSPGVGGHCLPIDPFYLTWKAREFGVNTRFIELAGEINNSMHEYTVNQVNEKLNDREKSIKGSKILVLGITYKKDVGDVRESPSIYIMEILRSKGADVHYSDPYWPIFPKMKKHDFNLSSVHVNNDNIKRFDCVIIATNHSNFDYDLIRDNASIIIDTRGVYQGNI